MMENGAFLNEDLDRIDVISTNNTGNRNDLQLSAILSDATSTEEALDEEPHSPTDSENLLRNYDSITQRKSRQHNDSSINIGNYGDNDDNRKSPLLRNSPNSEYRVSTPAHMMRRWSQSMIRYRKDKYSFKEKPGYRLTASRKIFEGGDLNELLTSDENDWSQYLQEIEQHAYLMQNTALSKQSRLETLKSLPQPLAIRRLVKRQLTIAIEQHANEELSKRRYDINSLCKFIANFIILSALKIWSLFVAIHKATEIWYGSLKIISGHFGSNVSSYFEFLRWLFVLNCIVFLCTTCFITLPQIIYNFESEATDNDSFEDALVEENQQNIELDSRPTNDSCSQFVYLLTGEGALEHSLIFYGGYSNATFMSSGSKIVYSLPFAYYLTMMLVYLVSFITISTSMARSYRKSFIETSGGLRIVYSIKIFCSWDYSIAYQKAADVKHLSIFTELKEILSEIVEAKVKYSIIRRLWTWCWQIVTHAFVLALIAGLGVGLLILLQTYEGSAYQSLSSWTALSVATFINVSLIFLQTIFSWISKMEDYNSPQRALHITLLRSFLSESVVIGVLVYFWLTKEYGECWETSIGQEIYRLIISDFFISLLVIPVFNCIRVFVTKRFYSQWGQPEFDISQKSLNLVYNQTLLWVGLLFAPLLAAVVVGKMVIMFYVNKAMLLYLCKSPKHVWRSSQTNTLYLVFIFLSLLGVIVALGYLITQVPVSRNCGPFDGYAYMIQIFIDGILELRKSERLWKILTLLIRPAAVGVILIIMTIMVYYLRAKSRAHCMMVKLLKDMLYMEAKDKEFLLTSITNITKDREWVFDEEVNGERVEAKTVNQERLLKTANLLDNNVSAETSNTWRYTTKNSRKKTDENTCDSDSGQQNTSHSPTDSSAVTVTDECTLRSRNI